MPCQPVAVAAGVATDLSVVFEDERARHDRVEEIPVVANDEQRAIVLGQSILQRFERLDVEIVRRLVEHEQVRRAREQLRENDAIAFAAGQRRDRRHRALGGEQKVGEIGDDVFLVPLNRDVLATFADGFRDCLAAVELAAQLVEVGHL